MYSYTEYSDQASSLQRHINKAIMGWLTVENTDVTIKDNSLYTETRYNDKIRHNKMTI